MYHSLGGSSGSSQAPQLRVQPAGARLCLPAAMVPRRRSAPPRGGQGGAQAEVGEAVSKPAPAKAETKPKKGGGKG